MLKSLPKWAKIAISTFIAVIVVGVVFTFVFVPEVGIIVAYVLSCVAAVVAVSMVVYSLMFGE